MKKLARNENVGVGVHIDPTAEFINVDYLEIGDHSFIGPGVRVIGGELTVGEYSKIHNNCYIYAKNGIQLGNCTWIGQGTHLDGTGGISAGDFLGVGINSALYSHIRHGDISEGCGYSKDGFLAIGHDVWFVGMCMVSPVSVEDKSMALLGSVITRDMKQNRTYAGNPAADITDKIGRPWNDVSIDMKTERVRKEVEYFFTNIRPDLNRDAVEVTDIEISSGGRTVYCTSTRTYSKRNSIEEIELNKWMFGFRAKFRPQSISDIKTDSAI
jgi:acetyltransferase-like isoleucine patch superfamily enzyme